MLHITSRIKLRFIKQITSQIVNAESCKCNLTNEDTYLQKEQISAALQSEKSQCWVWGERLCVCWDTRMEPEAHCSFQAKFKFLGSILQPLKARMITLQQVGLWTITTPRDLGWVSPSFSVLMNSPTDLAQWEELVISPDHHHELSSSFPQTLWTRKASSKSRSCLGPNKWPDSRSCHKSQMSPPGAARHCTSCTRTAVLAFHLLNLGTSQAEACHHLE